MVNNKGWGGSRADAGRPKTSQSKLYAFRVGKDLSEYIDRQDNKTEFFRKSVSLYRDLQEQADSQAEAIGSLGDVYPAARIKPLSIPFFDLKVVAGFPIPMNTDELSKDIELLRMLCPNPEASYLIRVQGSSMIDSDIHDGDIIIVDKSNRDPLPQDVAVCELNGEYTIKRLVKEEGRMWLVPANPGFPKIEIHQGDDFNVWGIVTYVIHKPRM